MAALAPDRRATRFPTRKTGDRPVPSAPAAYPCGFMGRLICAAIVIRNIGQQRNQESISPYLIPDRVRRRHPDP